MKKDLVFFFVIQSRGIFPHGKVIKLICEKQNNVVEKRKNFIPLLHLI